MERPGGEGCLSRSAQRKSTHLQNAGQGRTPATGPRVLLSFPLLSFGVWHVSLRWGPKAPAIVGAFCTSEYMHVQPISRASEEGAERLLSYRAETSGSPEADDL